LPKIVETLLQQPAPPDYLVVEVSGLASPKQVAELFKQQAGSLVQIDSIIAVVDAEQLRTLEDDDAQIAQRQIQEADLVIINKIDLIPSFSLGAVKRLLGQIAPGIRTFETSFGQIPLDLLIGLGEYVQLTRLQRSQADADRPIWNYPFHLPIPPTPKVNQSVQAVDNCQIWTYTSQEPFHYASLCQALQEIPDSLFRIKGRALLADSNRTAQIQIVGKYASLRLNELTIQPAEKTQIVAVGSKGETDSDRLLQLFDSCGISVAEHAKDNPFIFNYTWMRSRQ
jgi:G3E family GTPase